MLGKLGSLGILEMIKVVCERGGLPGAARAGRDCAYEAGRVAVNCATRDLAFESRGAIRVLLSVQLTLPGLEAFSKVPILWDDAWGFSVN
ncbi:hypothetical protein V6N13_092619 [Hibiscus sabdariffa]